MPLPTIPFWKTIPVFRLLLAFCTGILIQFSYRFPVETLTAAASCCFILFIASGILSPKLRYQLALFNGIIICLLFLLLGMLVTRQNDVRETMLIPDKECKDPPIRVLTLEEKPVKKSRSYKSTATVNDIICDKRVTKASSRLILYFASDPHLEPGQKIITKATPQEISSSGNPGGFDYKRYCQLQGIVQQLYITDSSFIVVSPVARFSSNYLLYRMRESIVSVLRSYIPGERNIGLAEALLIGYKEDLDKSLVRSYSNTGVVHIIAISGLHVGLIYLLLAKAFHFLTRNKRWRFLHALLVLCGLWVFSLLAGAQPSILRSTIMFSCVVIGQGLGRHGNIFNSLAVSAFLLLCYNPFWLWDAGFQLSYSAVLSILLFAKPVYRWIYFPNKLIDLCWQLTSVTIAAQILTTPFCLYHFHQFPVYFLLTNFIAVPLSSLILLLEILLCLISFWPALAHLIGWITGALIQFMNATVERFEQMPFALWEGIQINACQAALLIIVALAIGYGFIERSRAAFYFSIFPILAFMIIRSASFIADEQQSKLIVYNTPGKTAIDLIDGRAAGFMGDTGVLRNQSAYDFYLKPSRILHRIDPARRNSTVLVHDIFISTGRSRIVWLSKRMVFESTPVSLPIDLLIVSGKTPSNLENLTQTFAIKQVVTDPTVPAYLVKKWKADAALAGISYHDIKSDGAFVMNLR